VIPQIPEPLPYAEFNELYTHLSQYVSSHVVLDPLDLHAVVTWILATWKVEALDGVCYLYLNAPKGHGKTRLGEVLVELCHKAIPGSFATRAALMRLYDDEKDFTLILDEAEHYLDPYRKSDIVALLNAGQRRGQKMLVVDEVQETDPETGKKHTVRRTVAREAFGFKVLASRSDIFDTLSDRAFEIVMSKGRPKQRTVDKPVAYELRRKLAYYKLNEPLYMPSSMPEYVDPRLEELATVLMSVVPPEFHQPIIDLVRREVKTRNARMLDTLEAKLLQTIKELLESPEDFKEIQRLQLIETTKIADSYNFKNCPEGKFGLKPLTTDRVGKTLSRLKLERLRVRDDIELKRGFKYDPDKLTTLFRNFGITLDEQLAVDLPKQALLADSVPPVPRVPPLEHDTPLLSPTPLSSIFGGTDGTRGTNQGDKP
jgi:hypothetical protein